MKQFIKDNFILTKVKSFTMYFPECANCGYDVGLESLKKGYRFCPKCGHPLDRMSGNTICDEGVVSYE